jgi:hypothetical protein
MVSSFIHFTGLGDDMFLLLALVLVIIWAVSFFAFHVSAFFIHLLIVFAVISLIMHLVRGRSAS